LRRRPRRKLATQAQDLFAVTFRAASEGFHEVTRNAHMLLPREGQGLNRSEEPRLSCRSSRIPT
jgi:hypothetical protein